MHNANSMLQRTRIYVNVEDGLAELRKLLALAKDHDNRATLESLIRTLETGEMTAALYLPMFQDGSISPIIIGGDIKDWVRVIKQIQTGLQQERTSTLH